MSNAVISELFATKGIEYLLVIGFLVTLILFWHFLNRSPQRPEAPGPVSWSFVPGSWFGLRTGDYYHPGHAWLRPIGRKRVRVGIDDFARKLLGQPDEIRLPREGDLVTQGDLGWSLHFGKRSIPMLSPVTGTVVARNVAAARDFDRITADPRADDWLLEIETPRMQSILSNLLSGAVARSWMETTERLFRQRVSGELGAVLQDGGVPVSGMARAIAPEAWEEIARGFLLTKDLSC